jgi:hypothetical protein
MSRKKSLDVKCVNVLMSQLIYIAHEESITLNDEEQTQLLNQIFAYVSIHPWPISICLLRMLFVFLNQKNSLNNDGQKIIDAIKKIVNDCTSCDLLISLLT